MFTYSNRLQPALWNLLQRVVRFFHPRLSCTTHISAGRFWRTKITPKASDAAESLQLYRVFRFFHLRSSCMTTYIRGRSENNIKCVVHDDLRRKNQTTRYILPHHWLYEWFSQFHVVKLIQFFHGAFTCFGFAEKAAQQQQQRLQCDLLILTHQLTFVCRSSECCHLSSSCSYCLCLCSYATRSLNEAPSAMSGSVGRALWQCSNQSLKLSWASCHIHIPHKQGPSRFTICGDTCPPTCVNWASLWGRPQPASQAGPMHESGGVGEVS